jgi:hypothetical protein
MIPLRAALRLAICLASNRFENRAGMRIKKSKKGLTNFSARGTLLLVENYRTPRHKVEAFLFFRSRHRAAVSAALRIQQHNKNKRAQNSRLDRARRRAAFRAVSSAAFGAAHHT